MPVTACHCLTCHMSTRVLESHGFKMQAKGTVMNQKLMTKIEKKASKAMATATETFKRY